MANIVLLLLKAYGLLALMTMTHELFHIIAAAIWRIPIVKIVIGMEKVSVRFGKLYLSPFIFSGFVEVVHEVLESRGKTAVLCFFLSGSVGNVILALSPLVFRGTIFIFFAWTNAAAVILNFLPCFPENDFSMARKIIRSM